MARPLRAVASALTDRTTLLLFVCLAGGWFVPSAVPILGYLLYPLFLPAYLVSMVTYDGLLGLEHVAYAVAETLSISGPIVFDAGLAVTFYLFAVVAVLLGGLLEQRFGPDTAADTHDEAAEPPTRGRFRYAVAAGLLLLGLLLVVQGVAVQPMMTSETCTGSSSAGQAGSEPTETMTCTTTTEPATGQQLYILGLGAGIGTLGAGIVGADRWLAAR